MIAAPAWSVHLGTAVETRFHLFLPRWRAEDPWPMQRILAELGALGAVRSEAPRALGRGRGMPLLMSQELSWHGVLVYVELSGDERAGVEAIVELPSWDELITAVADEDMVWELVDVVASAADAGSGVIADGETPLGADVRGRNWRRPLQRHVGVLVAEGSVDPGGAGCCYRMLPRAGLEVLLR